MKIINGTITVDGQIYKAFENSLTHTWSIVKGETYDCPSVMVGIKAKNAKEALSIWIEKMF